MKNNNHKQNDPDPDIPAKFVETTFRVRYAETGATLVSGYTQHTCLNRAGNVTRIPDKWQLFLRQDLPVTMLGPPR